MREAFEKAAQAYNKVKESMQEKWEGFKKKFEGTKSEMSREVINAKSPEDLIALGKKLQEQGEALKMEEGGIKKEEVGEEEEYEKGKQEMIDKDEEEAYKMNEKFDEDKAAKEAEEAQKAEEERKLQTEEDAKKIAKDEQKVAELLAKIKSGDLGKENSTSEVAQEKNVESTKKIPEDEKINVVALNNKVVELKMKLPSPKNLKAYEDALANMTQAEISAVAKNISKEIDLKNKEPRNWQDAFSHLDNFGNKPEIIA